MVCSLRIQLIQFLQIQFLGTALLPLEAFCVAMICLLRRALFVTF